MGDGIVKPKVCACCRKSKPLEAFNRDARAPGGFNRLCRECRRAQMIEWREVNRERCREYQRAYVARNPEKVRAMQLAYTEANWQTHMARVKRWQMANPHVVNASTARRYVRKKQSTPPWACPFIIEWYYYDARWMTQATGIKHHVDHFYPLRGKTVSGLHCETNLQVIPATVNHAKNRRMPET